MLKQIIAAGIIWVAAFGPVGAQAQSYPDVTPICEGDESVDFEQREISCSSEVFDIRISYILKPNWWIFEEAETEWLMSALSDNGTVPSSVYRQVLLRAFPQREMQPLEESPVYFRVPTSRSTFCNAGTVLVESPRRFRAAAYRCYVRSGRHTAIHDLTANSPNLSNGYALAVISVLLGQ